MNDLKTKFASRDALRGIWLSTGSHVAAELAAAAGFDWALLDMEHGVGDQTDIMRQIQVLTPTACAPLVRVPSANSDAVKWVLDCGAVGIIAPMIAGVAEAEAFARALRYPPDGTRGLTTAGRASRYGHDFKEYFANANRAVTGIVQIETAAAVADVEAIAAVPGVDVLFIGHSDLSLNLGCFGQHSHPAVVDAEAAVLAACARHGKRAGMQLKAGMNAEDYRRKGFSLLALGIDIACLKQGFESLLA